MSRYVNNEREKRREEREREREREAVRDTDRYCEEQLLRKSLLSHPFSD